MATRNPAQRRIEGIRMTRKTSDERWDDVQRQLGRVEESQERAAEDRSEIRDAVKEWREVAMDLRSAVAGLTQTVQSMTAQVLALNAEKCGQRLDAIECKNEHYDRVLGRASSFVWRVLLYLALAAIAGGTAAKIVEWF
jgi:chromosome segregation ATPase